MQPRPRRREYDAEENCAKREYDERCCHHTRAFVRVAGHRLEVSVPVPVASIAEKDVDDLARHVERGQDDAGQNEVIGHVRPRPIRRGVQNFFFRPASRKKERHATERHHTNGVCEECDRHEPAQAAHFANVLVMMTSVNHRACAEK